MSRTSNNASIRKISSSLLYTAQVFYLVRRFFISVIILYNLWLSVNNLVTASSLVVHVTVPVAGACKPRVERARNLMSASLGNPSVILLWGDTFLPFPWQMQTMAFTIIGHSKALKIYLPAFNKYITMYRWQNIMRNISKSCSAALEAIFDQRCIASCTLDYTNRHLLFPLIHI